MVSLEKGSLRGERCTSHQHRLGEGRGNDIVGGVFVGEGRVSANPQVGRQEDKKWSDNPVKAVWLEAS